MNTAFNVSTSQQIQFTDITSRVQQVVDDSDIDDGIVIVYVPHTTAGVTINENADPSVRHDIIMQLDKIVPERGGYTHAEGNSPAHIKASMMGSSITVIVSGGKLNLGTWQGIFFCEFDGPRNRKVWIKVIKG